jgi:nucleoside-diphosphate-sugar epimerase
MLAGKPVVVAGDGTSPWTVTRSEDFAVPFVNLFGKPAALGEIFHITSDKGYGWDQIYRAIGAGLGVKANIVHVPTDTLIRYNKAWEGPLLGDKTWAALFDNSKVKRVAGDFDCVEEIDGVLVEPIKYLKKRLAAGSGLNAEMDPLFDRITSEQLALGT